MSKPTAVSFADIALPKQGVAVLLAEEGPTLSPAGKALDKASGGTLTKAFKERKFKGKKKSSLDLIVPGDSGLSRVLIVGVDAL